MNVNLISINDSAYPVKLREIPDAPAKLYVVGNLDNLQNNPCLSVVGSRKVTPYGKSVTDNLVNTVAAHGITIISGLALGVDTIAHRAALDSGSTTVAVLPCGLDKIYPASNLQLARRILENNGALISEYQPHTPPLQHHFIARNRIVAGLGDAVLITEAAAKSGTMHTVGFALDQGKSILAVPGNITNTFSEGTNNLIKAGATPITVPEDILDCLGINDKTTVINDVLPATEQEAIILDLLKLGITDINELQDESKLSVSEFNQTLTMLEITGKVRSTGAGHWSIR